MAWKKVKECIGAQRTACIRPKADGSVREEQLRNSSHEAAEKRRGVNQRDPGESCTRQGAERVLKGFKAGRDMSGLCFRKIILTAVARKGFGVRRLKNMYLGLSAAFSQST